MGSSRSVSGLYFARQFAVAGANRRGSNGARRVHIAERNRGITAAPDRAGADGVNPSRWWTGDFHEGPRRGELASRNRAQ